MTRIYHIVGAKIEGLLVDNPGAADNWQEYAENMNGSKTGNYDAMNLIRKVLREQRRTAQKMP